MSHGSGISDRYRDRGSDGPSDAGDRYGDRYGDRDGGDRYGDRYGGRDSPPPGDDFGSWKESQLRDQLEEAQRELEVRERQLKMEQEKQQLARDEAREQWEQVYAEATAGWAARIAAGKVGRGHQAAADFAAGFEVPARLQAHYYGPDAEARSL